MLGRIPALAAAGAVGDFILGVLFIISYRRLRAAEQQSMMR